MSSQNHNMNMNMVKASAMKLPKVNPPSNSIVLIPYPNRVSAILDQCGRKAQRGFVRFARIPASDLHQARRGEPFSTGAEWISSAARDLHLVRIKCEVGL